MAGNAAPEIPTPTSQVVENAVAAAVQPEVPVVPRQSILKKLLNRITGKNPADLKPVDVKTIVPEEVAAAAKPVELNEFGEIK